MPRYSNRLTAKEVAKNTTPGLYADGGNLWLQVTSATARSWIFRYQQDQRTRTLGLGSVQMVSLAQAREKAQAMREAVYEKRSPKVAVQLMAPPATHAPAAAADASPEHPRLAPNAKPMTEVVREYIEVKGAAWKGTRASQVQARFDNHAKKLIGKLYPDQVTQAHIVAILDPIWTAKHATAADLRAELESALAFATARQMRLDTPNPAQWAGRLEHALASPDKMQKGNHAALDWRSMPEFMTALQAVAKDHVAVFGKGRAYDESDWGARARTLQVAIYCQSRGNEIRNLRWADLLHLDSDRPLWALEAGDMKGERKHLVPMPAAAAEVIRSLRRGKDSQFVFLEDGAQVASNAMGRLIHKMGYAATPHGLARASFKTWTLEATEFDQKLVELALAHNVGDATEGAYVRGGAVDRRGEVLSAWADYLNGKKATSAKVRTYTYADDAKVVKLPARRKAA